MARHFSSALLLMLGLAMPVALSGCAVVVAGMGVGTGAAVYHSGAVARTYEADYHRAVGAGVETLQQLKIPPGRETGDELKTEIMALRPDGSPVKLDIERLDPGKTRITIRVGKIGIADRGASNQIHDLIEQRLLRPQPQTQPAAQTAPQAADAPPAEDPGGKPVKARAKTPPPEPASPKTNPPEAGLKPEGGAKRTATPSPAPAKYIIFFSQDSHLPQEKSKAKLSEIAALISEHPEVLLTITGFSDAKGSSDYRKLLSERRANTVKRYLMAGGMDPSRSQVVVQDAEGDLPNQGALVEIAY